MKKITKFLVVALTVALLIGAVVGVSSSATSGSGDEEWVISKNVSYEENTHLYFAIDASKATDSTLLKVDVLDAAGTSLVGEELLTVSEASKDIYKDGSVLAHIVKTPGVAAKDMADVFTINVYYDGSEEPVDSITYSVAEYFLERLYSNGVIEATTDEAISQKNLYLASLKYGSAAQKLLASTDTTLVENLVYIISEEETIAGVFDSAKYLELPDGYWSVSSFVDGEKVKSVVQGGLFSISNSAEITSVGESKYEMPDTSVDFDVSETYDYGFSGAASKDLEYSAGAISKVYYRQDSDATTLAVTVENDDTYGDYIRVNKSVAGNKQTWMNINIDTTKTADLSTIVFEARMRLNISTFGSGYRIRMYTGNRTNSGGGTEVYGTVFTSHSELKKYSGSDSKNLGTSKNTWFTIRFEVSDYVEGENNYVVSILDESTQQFVEKYTASVSAITDASAISCICLMDSSTTVYTNDIQYLYVGDKIPAVEVPEATESVGISAIDESDYGQVKYAEYKFDIDGDGIYDRETLTDDTTKTNYKSNGYEPYVDANENGQYDAAEAFVDANENGVYDEGEEFTDANENGVWDAAEDYEDANEDGVWSENLGYIDSNKNDKLDWDVKSATYPLVDESGNPVPVFKGNVSIVRDIITNEPILILEDVAGQNDKASGNISKELAEKYDYGQAIIRFNRDGAMGATSTTIEATARIYIGKLSNGTFAAGKNSGPAFRLQSSSNSGYSSITDLMYVYWGNDGDTVTFTIRNASGSWQTQQTTDVNLGEWFDVKYVYTYDASTSTATTTISVTNEAGETTDYTQYTPSANSAIAGLYVRLSLVPSKTFQGIFSATDVVITDK